MDENAKFRTIPLEGRVAPAGPVAFLKADVSSGSNATFAIVHYAYGGDEQPLGLRLDLDKRVFLDHVDDPRHDETLANSAGAVADALLETLAEQDDHRFGRS